MQIVPAHRDDVAGVIALIGRVFEEFGFVYEPTTEVRDLLEFPAHYEPPQGTFFVVREGDRIDTDLRGRGLGQTLVNEAIAWCRARAISRLILWSNTRFDRAHRLYTRMGFQPSGERVLPGDVNNSREYGFERSV